MKTNKKVNNTTTNSVEQTAKNMAFAALESNEKINKYIKEMEPFIISCANPYIAIAEQYRDDMLNEARLAFYEAITRFDYEQNGFYKYTKNAICISMRTFLKNNTRLIKIPSNKIEKYLKIRKISIEMEKNGEDITEASLMKRCSIKSLKTFRNALSSSRVNNIVSYDNYINSDNTYERFYSSTEDLEEDFCYKNEIEELQKKLNEYNFLDRYIIENFYGLNDTKEKPLSKIALELKIKESEIRKRYKLIINKLKNELTHNSNYTVA